MASWQLDRANRVEVARLARNIHIEPAMAEFREKQHAERWGSGCSSTVEGRWSCIRRNYDN